MFLDTLQGLSGIATLGQSLIQMVLVLVQVICVSNHILGPLVKCAYYSQLGRWSICLVFLYVLILIIIGLIHCECIQEGHGAVTFLTLLFWW